MSYLTNFAAACTASVGKLCTDSLPKATSAAGSGNIHSIIQIVIVIMGAVALLIITLAGLQYVLSQGDSQKVAKAKNAIIYALIGLVVIIFAQVIVTFVVRNV